MYVMFHSGWLSGHVSRGSDSGECSGHVGRFLGVPKRFRQVLGRLP